MLCRNLVSYKSGLIDEAGDELLAMNIIHERDLDFATDADIHGTVHRLADFARNNGIGLTRLYQCCLSPGDEA